MYLPPLHMYVLPPLGSVDQPNPCPHGKIQANVAFASESFVLLLKTATAASLRICELRTASRLLRLDETSEFVAAVIVNYTKNIQFKWNGIQFSNWNRKSTYGKTHVHGVRRNSGDQIFFFTPMIYHIFGISNLFSLFMYRKMLTSYPN